MTKRKKTSKRKLSETEKEQRRFRNEIKRTFVNSGFDYTSVEGFHFQLNERTIEIDFLITYENIILVCEDTISKSSNIEDHLRKKNQGFEQILQNKSEFIDIMRNKLSSKISNTYWCTCPLSRCRIMFVYFTKNRSGISKRKKEQLYKYVTIVEPQTLTYLNKMSLAIKKSMKYEIFRFFGLKRSDIGPSGSGTERSTIEATIISPDQNTGLKNGVKMVSFMISAEELLQNSYVLRKDNWEESTWLYQRLIVPAKISKIREFIANNGTTFFNNIIVALPDNVKFENGDGNVVDLEAIDTFQTYKMIIPKEYNSICIIDGQHRIFAHYESNNDKYERKISILRKELHLLVTGLIFDNEKTMLERSQIQSEIFLDINSNAKPVPADVLLNIEMIKDPTSSMGVARRIIGELNETDVFNDMFEMSTLEKGKIKIASIIKFALRYLVVMDDNNSNSLYFHWKKSINRENSTISKDLNEYIEFSTNYLENYFCAIKKNNTEQWNKDTKLLTVISINGFILALSQQISYNGLKDYEYYDNCFKSYALDASNDKFQYTSSQYRKFSLEICEKAFGLNSYR